MTLTIEGNALHNYEQASSREWLVTNGLGGYASGSLSGANTRRYHGLLVAALTPPTCRMNLLSKVEEAVSVGGETVELSSNEYPGVVHPEGWRFLERYENEPAPTFFYRPLTGVSIRKRVWMAHRENTTYIEYSLLGSDGPVELRITPLVCWKDFHAEMHPWDGFPFTMEAAAGEARLRYTTDAPVLRLIVKGARWEPASYWHYNVQHARERDRGLDHSEDLYCPGHFLVTMKPGSSHTLTATIEERPTAARRSWAARLKRQESLLIASGASDTYARQLALAADQFIVEANTTPSDSTTPRPHDPTPSRTTIIAGYHWFSDWGRDTMIALPGLCIETGRLQAARDILTSFAGYVSEGILPNRFPDRGEEPEYNTVDATLWYFEAIRKTVEALTDGLDLARELWPTLTDIVAWHVRGTRYGIGVDPNDGLLRAGVPGVQLTWMDARVGDRVITPRIGKPVEINALWINALRTMEQLATALDEPACEFAERADLASISFRRQFVRPDGLGLFDVITDDWPDPAIRPNQIIAAGLPTCPLSHAEKESVVRTVESELVTPYGLRTLSPRDPAYRAHYGGAMEERDSAYHQGTVWPWLLGWFVEAHLSVYGNPEAARAFLEPLQGHLREACVGSISEVFDAEPPYRPDGCVSQAWSVAEILRAWNLVNRAAKR